MSVYLLLIIASIVIGIAIANNNRDVVVLGLNRRRIKGSNIFCACFAIAIVLLIGLRAPNVGSDTFGYYTSYRFNNITLDTFLNNYNNYLSAGVSNFFSQKNTLVFHFICSIFKAIGLSFNGCLIVLAMVYVFPMFYLISKDSGNVWKSCFWFITLSFSIALSGVRITLALGLTIISYICILHKKKWISVIFFLFAVTIHLSALVFLAVYFLAKIQISKRTVYYLIPIFIMTPVIGDVITPIIIGYTYYGDDSVLMWNLPIYLFFSITTILLLHYTSHENAEYNKMMIIGTLVCGLVNYGSFGNMHRYFTQYLCVCLPTMMKNGNKSIMILIEILYFIAGSYLYFRTFSYNSTFTPYLFFWQ